MSETNSTQPRHLLLYILVTLLIGVAGFQTWYIIDMKRNMDAIDGIFNSGMTAPATSTTNSQIARSAGKSQSPPSSISQQIQKNLNAQAQAGQQQPVPSDPLSLFDDDFFNQPFAGQNWNPREQIERMQRHMDQVFNQAFGHYSSNTGLHPLFKARTSTPEMHVSEDDSKYTVIVDLPGADEKNSSVNLEGQQLTVKGKQDVTEQKQDAMGNVVFRQHRTGTFQRSITLPTPVKQNGMLTHVDNGILTITVPKSG